MEEITEYKVVRELERLRHVKATEADELAPKGGISYPLLFF